MTLVTALPRILPLLFLAGRSLPPFVARWLSYVPVAVLAALLAPSLLSPQGALTLAPADNLYFWAGLPTFALALKTRNLFLTVLGGMIALSLLRLLLS